MELIKTMIKNKRNPIYCVYKYLFCLYGKKHPMWLANKQYKKNFGRSINWSNPTEMNEKIRWMQFYTDTSKWSYLADKFLTREYVESKGYGDILVPLLGVWSNANDIDFEKLPVQFVIKTNHGCGDVFIVKDKRKTNLEEIRHKLNYYLNKPFGYETAELHYLSIKPRIIAEHLLPTDNHFSSSIVDYKFYCVNGEPYCCGVFYDRCPQTHHTNSTFYDMQWKRHDEWRNPTIKTPSKDISRPYTFDRMKQICKDLAKDFPFVRLDFYEANKHVYFGEFTFTPAALSGGSMNLELCNEIGRLIILPSKTC